MDHGGEIPNCDGGSQGEGVYIRHLSRAQDQRDLGLPLARQVSGGGKKGLFNGASDANAYKVEIEKLQKIIGKQPIQIEILKKNGGAVRKKVEVVKVLRDLEYTGEGCLSCSWDVKERILRSTLCEESEDRSRGERSGSFGTDQDSQDGPSSLGLSTGESVAGAPRQNPG